MKISARAHLVTRPLRFGFLVRPGNLSDLREAVQTANVQWGGRWSVMVPMFARRPRAWRIEHEQDVTGASIATNIIDRFDPDLLVRPEGMDLPQEMHGRLVLTHEELHGGRLGGGCPQYGIGAVETVRAVFERELKFVRTIPTRLRLPVLPRTGRLWWQMVYGELDSRVADELAALTEAERTPATLGTLFEHLLGGALLPIDLLDCGIKTHGGGPPPGRFLYVHRHSEWLDLIDLWNLRALGVRIIPVPWSAVGADALGLLGSWVAARAGGPPERTATVLRSRRLSGADFEAFSDALREASPAHREPLFSRRDSVFAYWSPWRGQRHDDAPPRLVAGRAWRNLLVEEIAGGQHAEVPLVAPPFPNLSQPGRQAAYANDVELHLFGSDLNLARVVPPGDRSYTQRLHDFLMGGGRITDRGLAIAGVDLTLPS